MEGEDFEMGMDLMDYVEKGDVEDVGGVESPVDGLIEDDPEEIRPETDEPEVSDLTQAFPTEAHIKQKAKEKRIKEETGET